MIASVLRWLTILIACSVVLLQYAGGACLAEMPSVTRLRVLSYNIHHGEGVDGKLDLERIAAVIRGAEPDLVALQEVDRNTARTKHVDQPRQLGRLTGMPVVFGRNIPYEGGEYGNAVLSRRPIKRHENHPLPSLGPGERRGVLEVEIELADRRPLLFFVTHLDHRMADRERIASAKAINEQVSKSNTSLAILAGDLNDFPQSETLRIFGRAWRVPQEQPLPTVPADQPRRQIDFILVRPQQGWKVADVRVLDEPVASDHRPLLATFELPLP